MKIVNSKTFEKSFLGLSNKELQIKIIEKIEKLGNEDDNLDIKKLQPKEKGIYRLRVGKYRILFRYIDSETIKLLELDNRDSIYLNI